ncbi:MAG: hypothetical protein AAF618_06025 [Pseudomonadota bacterium]
MLGAPALLAACAAPNPKFAPTEAVQAAVWPNDGPPRISLFSSFNVGSNNGAHTALLIHADQVVAFDPAGTFAHETLPERHDVIYGMRPEARRAFVDYHTRVTYWTTLQTVDVPMETAMHILRSAERIGPQPRSFCTRSTSMLLAQAPGMPKPVRVTWFPDFLHDQFLDMPGVTRQEFHQTDDADKEKFWETAVL